MNIQLQVLTIYVYGSIIYATIQLEKRIRFQFMSPQISQKNCQLIAKENKKAVIFTHHQAVFHASPRDNFTYHGSFAKVSVPVQFMIP